MWAVFLAVLHWYLRLCIAVARLCQRLYAVICLNIKRPSAGALRKRLSSIEKLPVHLSFVFVEDDLSFSDIARLVAWSSVAGVAYVSIYDCKGLCKQKKDLLLQKCSDERSKLLKTECSANDNFGSRNGVVKNGLLSHHSTAADTQGSTQIFILGPEDGRQKIVDLARQCSREVTTHKLARTDITVSRVDEMMHEICGFPDPDMVLKFGTVDSLLGFLPWQIRLSEIISIRTHVNIYIQQFVDAFVTFSHMQQRFGK